MVEVSLPEPEAAFMAALFLSGGQFQLQSATENEVVTD